MGFMIKDRLPVMMDTSAGGIPDLKLVGDFSGAWKDLSERRISFRFVTGFDAVGDLSYGAFLMRCGKMHVVDFVIDFFPWHLLGIVAFFYLAETKGGAELWLYDPDTCCYVISLQPVPGTDRMVLTVRRNREYDDPYPEVCPVKFRCLVDREKFFHEFKKTLSQKVSDPALEKWIRPRLEYAFDKGVSREEKLAQIRKAEELVAGVAAVENDYGKHELYEDQYEDVELVAAALREANIIRQDPWAVGEPLPVRKLEEFLAPGA